MFSGRRWLSALGFAAAAVPALVSIWGFTVDDALISARVADHLARGQGYRFNSHGPVSDAVTPFGWAYLLSLVAGAGPWQVLTRARWAGAGAWLVAAGGIGWLLHDLPRRARVLAALALGSCLPLAAWAVSGMETPWVTLLAVVGLAPSRWADLALGAAAAWRPELLPWAVATSVLRARGGEAGAVPMRAMLFAAALAVAPAATVAAIRWSVFGTPVPLAATAKPSDFAHGLRYVVGGLLLSGPTWLLVAARSYRRVPASARVWGYGFVVHSFSLILAGGDWMSFYRLLVPVLPSVIVLGAELGATAPVWASGARALMVVASSSLLWSYQAGAARHIIEARRALIEAATPMFRDAHAIAAVDIGWVGAASSADILDLAGVTDPTVASFRGGHTTKRVPSALLVRRQVDTLVLLLDEGEPLLDPWTSSHFYYGVDRLLAQTTGDLGFAPVAVLPLEGTAKHYVILRRSQD